MKQKKNKTMLLLPCAVIVVMIGITTYFACSADDDWEGSPEYLHTHAPMLTRAGMDVSGDVDIEEFVIEAGSGTDTETIVSGMTMNVTIGWSAGDPGSCTLTQDKQHPSQTVVYNAYGDTLYHYISSSFVHDVVNDRTIYKDSSLSGGLRVVYSTCVYVTYEIYHYDSNRRLTNIETKSNQQLTFSVDASSSAHIQEH